MYLHLEKGVALCLNLNKLEFHPPMHDLHQVCLKWPSGSGEEAEKVKVYRQTDNKVQQLGDQNFQPWRDKNGK
jgi:hypothetical protein